MIFRKIEDTVNCKVKLYILLYEELALEKAMDMS
jgi:hypothetical protein